MTQQQYGLAPESEAFCPELYELYGREARAGYLPYLMSFTGWIKWQGEKRCGLWRSEERGTVRHTTGIKESRSTGREAMEPLSTYLSELEARAEEAYSQVYWNEYMRLYEPRYKSDREHLVYWSELAHRAAKAARERVLHGEQAASPAASTAAGADEGQWV